MKISWTCGFSFTSFNKSCWLDRGTDVKLDVIKLSPASLAAQVPWSKTIDLRLLKWSWSVMRSGRLWLHWAGLKEQEISCWRPACAFRRIKLKLKNEMRPTERLGSSPVYFFLFFSLPCWFLSGYPLLSGSDVLFVTDHLSLGECCLRRAPNSSFSEWWDGNEVCEMEGGKHSWCQTSGII